MLTLACGGQFPFNSFVCMKSSLKILCKSIKTKGQWPFRETKKSKGTLQRYPCRKPANGDKSLKAGKWQGSLKPTFHLTAGQKSWSENLLYCQHIAIFKFRILHQQIFALMYI